MFSMGLLIWKIIGYAVLVFFGIGIAIQILGGIAAIVTPFILAGLFFLSVLTYPFVALIRLAGYRSCPSLFPVWHFFTNARAQEKVESSHQRGASKQQSSKANKEPRKEKSMAPSFDPWIILDIPRDASQQDIKTAYKKKMALNHPDKVASLDPALQTFATQRTLLLQKAYEQLVRSI